MTDQTDRVLSAIDATRDPIFGLPYEHCPAPDPSRWVADVDRAHELARVEHEDRLAAEYHDLARAETLAAADWPDHAYPADLPRAARATPGVRHTMGGVQPHATLTDEATTAGGE